MSDHSPPPRVGKDQGSDSSDKKMAYFTAKHYIDARIFMKKEGGRKTEEEVLLDYKSQINKGS
jgi:hypothetical protein